jgi:hypothetical protein
MKSQVVILKVKFDEDSFEPKSWNWSEIIGCDADCVEVMNYGTVENVPPKKDVSVS